MKRLRVPVVTAALLTVALAGPTVIAKDKTPGSITVAFGTGNNNAQPGNKPNHHVLPQEIKVCITKAKNLAGETLVVPATVNFIVSGFHWIWAYEDGVQLGDIVIPAAGTFVDYEVNVFAKGVFPGTPPAFTDATLFPLSSAQNRTDSIAFSAPGRYLVICNVRGHFIDGMYAWVTVVEDDDN
jgi:hypothetical protein